MTDDLKNELGKQENMFDFLQVLVKKYDLKKCKLSPTIRLVLIGSISNVIKLINAKEKAQ